MKLAVEATFFFYRGFDPLLFHNKPGKLEALKEEAEEHDSKLKELKRAKDKATKVTLIFSTFLFSVLFFVRFLSRFSQKTVQRCRPCVDSTLICVYQCSSGLVIIGRVGIAQRMHPLDPPRP